MELDHIWDSVAVVHRLPVGKIELDGYAKVAAEDDDGRYGQVEEEHGDDKGEAVVFHISPGQRAGQAKGLWPIATPAQYGEQSPDQSIQPGPQAQHLHFDPSDFLSCRERDKDSAIYQ